MNSNADILALFRRVATEAGYAKPAALDDIAEAPGKAALQFDTSQIDQWPGLIGRLVLMAGRSNVGQLPTTALHAALTRVSMGRLAFSPEHHFYRAAFPIVEDDNLIETKVKLIKMVSSHFLDDLKYAYGDAQHVAEPWLPSGISPAALNAVIEACRLPDVTCRAVNHSIAVEVRSDAGTVANLRVMPRMYHPAHGIGARFDMLMPSAPPSRGYAFIGTINKIAHPIAELGQWHIRQPGWRPARRTFLPGIIPDGLLIIWLQAEIHSLGIALHIYDKHDDEDAVS